MKNFLLSKLNVVIILFILLMACNKEDNTQYELKVSAVPAEGGSVDPVDGQFDSGAEINVSAMASEGYFFKSWNGSFTGNKNPISLVIDSDTQLTAIFELLDTDGDGISNLVDLCPGTPSGEYVNEKGCSGSQTDADQDGVSDEKDQCPDTPSGFSIDENGCPTVKRTFVPDDFFEQYLIDLGYDDKLDDYVLTSNIDEVKTLSIISEEQLAFVDVTGLEDFISLEKLSIIVTPITSFDITKFEKLLELTLIETQIPSLEIKDHCLEFLTIQGNSLSDLNISNNHNLKRIFLEDIFAPVDGSINSIHIEGNKSLEHVRLFDVEDMHTIKISSNQNLQTVDFEGVRNDLDLIISDNNKLELIVILSGMVDSSPDFSDNPHIKRLELSPNNPISLNVTDYLNLESLSVFLSNASIDVSHNSELDVLEVFGAGPICIQVNQEQLDNIPPGWLKGPDDFYSLNCD